MRKKFNTIIAFSLIIFAFGCAEYKPIFSSGNIQFEITDHLIEGDSFLGNKIYTKLYNLSKFKSDKSDIVGIEFIIDSTKQKKATSKDTAGKVLEYKIILTTKIDAMNSSTGEKIFNHSFVHSLVYKVQSQYSETLKFENKAIETLINQTHQDIIIKLSQGLLIK